MLAHIMPIPNKTSEEPSQPTLSPEQPPKIAESEAPWPTHQSQAGEDSLHRNNKPCQHLTLWEKYLKSYLRLSTKNHGSRWPKLFKNELFCCLSLLGHHSDTRGTSPPNLNLKVKGLYKRPCCTTNSKKRPKQPSSLILSHTVTYSPRHELLFSINVLDSAGIILYNTIFLQNWSDLQKEVAYVRKNFDIVIMAIEDKEAFVNVLPFKNESFREFIQNCHQLSEVISMTSSLNSSVEPSRQDQTYKGQFKFEKNAEIFREALSRFNFIWCGLQNNTKKQQGSTPQRYTPFLALAHNLALPMVSSTERTLESQVRHLLPSLQKCLQKLIHHEGTPYENFHEPDHHPISLTNAHLCWSCKKKRGYTACPSCSIDEGKTISLCLNCYGPYHQASKEDNKRVLLLSIARKWQLLEQSTNLMVPSLSMIPRMPADPLANRVKKEEAL